MTANQSLSNWTPMTDMDAQIRRWRHTEYNIWMTVSHQPDHYEDGEQVMRWHGRVTLGKNITVGINEFNLCDESGCETAEDQTMAWAREWMKYSADQYIDSLDDADEWRL